MGDFFTTNSAKPKIRRRCRAPGFDFEVLHDTLDKRTFDAPFREATNFVLVAAKLCAFSSR
jgi:hypothetical protein